MAPSNRFRSPFVLASSMATALALSGCVHGVLGGSHGVQGSGRQASEERTVPAFDRISASGAMTVELKTGDKTKVHLSAEDNILPLIKTEVKDGTLHIHTSGSYTSNSSMSISVVTPHVKAVNLEGACSATVSGINEKKLDIDLSGACNVKAQGTADRIAVELNGASTADLSALRAKDARVDVNGAGSATVDVVGTLNASVSGVGKIDYMSKPATLKQSVTGVGSIRQKENPTHAKPTE
jgi:hypothetical protein